MYDTEAFAELVRYVRLKRGLSYEELRVMIGAETIHPITRTENNSRRFVGYLFAICRALGISISFHVEGVSLPSSLAAALVHAFDFTEPEDMHQAILLAESTAIHMAENDLFDALDPRLEPEFREDGTRPTGRNPGMTRRRNRFYADTETPDETEDATS